MGIEHEMKINVILSPVQLADGAVSGGNEKQIQASRKAGVSLSSPPATECSLGFSVF